MSDLLTYTLADDVATIRLDDGKANAFSNAMFDAVNAAMVTEIESLRAARASERAEIEEILATLEPVLKEA